MPILNRFFVCLFCWGLMAWPAWAQESVPKLARLITQTATTDQEKAAAIYRWITANISYDWEAFQRREPPASVPAEVLLRRRAVCEGFSKLYRAMCTEVGVVNQIVHGFVKGQDYAIGKPVDRPNHTWNALRLNGQWRLSDPTFGVNQQSGDFFFLPKPTDLIYTHFPEEARWQLLTDTVGLAEFEHYPVVYPAFFTFQPLPLHYQESLIRPQSDTLHLAFDTPMGSYMGAVLQGGPLLTERDLTQQIQRKSLVSTILVDNLQPNQLYRLDIFGALADTSRTYDLLMTYFLNTGKPGAGYTTTAQSRFQTDSVTQMPFGFINEYLDLQVAKDRPGTLRLLQGALPLHPRNPWLRVSLGEWHEAAQQPDQAEQYYTQALKIVPDHYRANYQMGVLNYNRAVQLTQELNQQKGAVAVQTRQAIKNQFQKAKPYLQRALRAKPGNVQLQEALRNID